MGGASEGAGEPVAAGEGRWEDWDEEEEEEELGTGCDGLVMHEQEQAEKLFDIGEDEVEEGVEAWPVDEDWEEDEPRGMLAGEGSEGSWQDPTPQLPAQLARDSSRKLLQVSPADKNKAHEEYLARRQEMLRRKEEWLQVSVSCKVAHGQAKQHARGTISVPSGSLLPPASMLQTRQAAMAAPGQLSTHVGVLASHL